MTTRIYLVRHGETVENAAGKFLGDLDVPLSENGILQAEQLGSLFKQFQDSSVIVYSSPLQRATKTATIICDSLGNEKPTTIEELREMSFGDWEGKTSKEVQPDDLKLWRQRSPGGSTKPTNGETLSHVADRAEHTLDSLTRKHPGQTIIVVTHVYFIKGALERASQVEDGHWSNRLFLDTGSVTLIDWSVDADKRIIRRVNWTPRLNSGSERWGPLKL